jgi:iron complex outermembrane receptor protein
MFKKKPLSMAVAAALVASSTGMLAKNAYAEEEAIIDEVVVTGSRIKSSVGDSPRPVSVISRLDIELSGLESVSDLLRNSAYGFGGFREQSGSSFGGVALVDLRGLGSDRTAVLINGRRVPGNPITGSSAVDLNSIPLSAVGRVEVLTDSASAIYGADAIGGVINIIMRDDFEGAEFEIGTEEPSREGADSDHFNFTFGAVGDKSSIIFSAEWYKRNPIFDKDRDYSKVSVTPNPNGGFPRQAVDTVGVSGFGNGAFALPNFDESFQIVDDCEGIGPGYYDIVDPFGVPGPGCGFGYADISMQTGGLDRTSTYLDARYEINEDLTLYLESRFTSMTSFGRYAPAAGGFVISPENQFNPRGHVGAGDVDGNGILDDGAAFYLTHRFVGHGNRDDNMERTEFDNVVGFEGSFDVAGGINFDAYIRHYEYTTKDEGENYVLNSNITQLVEDGEYDFRNPFSLDGTHLAAVASSKASLFRDIETEYVAAGISLDGAMFDLPAGQIGWAAGLETASERYKDEYDSFREALNVIGSAGNTSSGNRSRWAAFGELQIPVLDNLTVNLAARYDDYDDFGSEFSPQVAVRFQPHDMVVLRASWGEGFKAPNLGSVHQELSQSFNTVTDLRRCAAQGLSEADCPDGQVEQYTGGNKSLSAEQSESYNVGIVLSPLDNLTFSVDYYSVEIDEAVSTLELNDVLAFETAGTLPGGVIVNRGPTVDGVPGTILRCAGVDPKTINLGCGLINVFANLSSIEREGLDVRVQYDMNTDGYGALQFTLDYAKMVTYDEQATPVAGVTDRIGTPEYPEIRYNFSTRWMMNDWTVNYSLRYIDDTDGVSTGKYEDMMTHDLNVTWATPWGGEISAGARNITDEDPPIDTVASYDSEVVLDMYDVAGRIPYLTYRHFF